MNRWAERTGLKLALWINAWRINSCEKYYAKEAAMPDCDEFLLTVRMAMITKAWKARRTLQNKLEKVK